MKTKLSSSILVCLIAIAVMAIAGCGGAGNGNGSGGTTAVSVSVSPSSSQAIDQGQTLNITATVANDSSSKGVTWTMSGPGSLTSSTTTSVTYNAGTTGTGTATVNATSIADTTKSSSLTITVSASPSITTTSLGIGVQGTAYSQTIAVSGGAGAKTFSSTGNLPSGLTLNSSTGIISGTPTATATTSFTVKVTDSSAAGPQSASQVLGITINASGSGSGRVLQISTSQLALGSVNAAYTTTIGATGGTQPYTFSLDAATPTLPAGLTLNSSGTQATITGTPTAAANMKIVVDVKDASSAIAEAVFNLVVEPACPTGGNLGLLNGQYAFVMQGFGGSQAFPGAPGSGTSGPFNFIGWFSADGNGNLTAGTEDLDPSDESRTTSGITNGSYTVGSDNRGCITFTFGNATVTENLRFTAGTVVSGVATSAHFVAIDNSYRVGPGIMRLRNIGAFSNSTFFGNFAFGLSAPANSKTGRFAAAGMLNLNTTNGNITGVMDTNNNATIDNNGTAYPATPLSVTGTYAVDGSGRSGLTFVTSTGTMDAIMYVISPTDAFFISIDDQTQGALGFAGEMVSQAGSLGNASLSGNAILAAQGAANGVPEAQIGLLAASGTSFTLTNDVNKSGVLSTATQSATFSVASSGRVTLTNAGANPPILYLSNTDQGFVLGTDSAVTFGYLAAQSGSSFTNTSITGRFASGSIAPLTAGVAVQSGIANFSSGSLTGTLDQVSSTGILTSGTALSGSYTIASSGRGTITNTNGTQTIFYVVSPTTIYVMDSTPAPTDTNPYLATAQQ